jgi:methylenetetrahydrofolate dehydrogenase (NADP+)/methenyltetrahydrofolate cyclohydrolase
MAQLLKGKDAASAMMEDTRRDADALNACGVTPTLGIIRLGEREDDVSYEKGAKKRCDDAGAAVRNYVLPADTPQKTLLALIREVNADTSVHGVLLFRPLPKHIDDAVICESLRPEKDIDGITGASLAGVFAGKPWGFPPCTAEACMVLLAHYGFDPSGRRVVVIGRSMVVGRPVAMMLMHKNGTVTICHTGTRDLPAVVREGDIVIAASGKPESIGREHLREGQILVDVGIHAKPGGGLCGDIKFDEAAPFAAAITPVPGGVGTVTTAVLVNHVVRAAKIAAGNLIFGRGSRE